MRGSGRRAAAVPVLVLLALAGCTPGPGQGHEAREPAAAPSASPAPASGSAPAPASGSTSGSAVPVTPAQRATSAVRPQRPVAVRLPSGVVVPVRAASTTRRGLLDVPGDIGVAGWWDGGARLGDPFGSTLVAAHVDSSTQGLGPFAELLSLAGGERVRLDAAGLTQEFEVRSLRLVPQGPLTGRAGLFAPSGPAAAHAGHLRAAVRPQPWGLPTPRGGHGRAGVRRPQEVVAMSDPEEASTSRALIAGGVFVVLLVATVVVLAVRLSSDSAPDLAVSSEAARSGTPPRPLSPDETYVRTEVLPSGDIEVTQWIESTVLLFNLALSVPALAGTEDVVAEDVRVVADGRQATGPTRILGPSRSYSFLGARTVQVRYRLTGAVETSPSAPGRGLVRLTSLDVILRPRLGQRHPVGAGTRGAVPGLLGTVAAVRAEPVRHSRGRHRVDRRPHRGPRRRPGAGPGDARLRAHSTPGRT